MALLYHTKIIYYFLSGIKKKKTFQFYEISRGIKFSIIQLFYTAIQNKRMRKYIEHILVRRGRGNYCNILLQKPEGKGGIGI